MSDPTPLEKLGEALQEFVNDDNGEAVVILGAVVVYELTSFDDDGDQRNKISYTVPVPQTSMSSAAGLCDAGRHILKAAAIASDSYGGPGRWSDGE